MDGYMACELILTTNKNNSEILWNNEYIRNFEWFEFYQFCINDKFFQLLIVFISNYH